MTRRGFIRALLACIAILGLPRGAKVDLWPQSIEADWLADVRRAILDSLMRPSPYLALIERGPFPENAGGVR